MYETAKETLMYRTVLWTLWERERVGRFGRMTLKHVKYHVSNELPVQVRCTIKFAPMQRSHCLAFTRYSVSSDCRGTSILVDIKE